MWYTAMMPHGFSARTMKSVVKAANDVLSRSRRSPTTILNSTMCWFAERGRRAQRFFLRLIIPFGLPFVMEERFARQFSAVDWRRVHHSLCFCSLCCQSEAKSCLWQLKHFCWRSLAWSLRWNSWSLLLSLWLTMSDALSRMTSCSYDVENLQIKQLSNCTKSQRHAWMITNLKKKRMDQLEN